MESSQRKEINGEYEEYSCENERKLNISAASQLMCVLIRFFLPVYQLQAHECV